MVALQNTVEDHPTLPPVVLAAILDAAGKTGVDPDLLIALAWRESRYDASARNHRSSARGLLQFTSGTWLQAIHDFGEQHGAASYAAAIHQDASGRITVHGRSMRAAILRLRSDPTLSARMAAEALRRQCAATQMALGRSATPTDLYLSHVLGASGSARFLVALRQRPAAPSVDVIDRRVLRNAGLLAGDGRPMTVLHTYTAISVMLSVHRADARAAEGDPEAAARDGSDWPSEVAQLIPAAQKWCTFSTLIVCPRTTQHAFPLLPS